jgi:lipoprotein NlpI
VLRLPIAPEELSPAKKDLVFRVGQAAFLAGEGGDEEARREYQQLLTAYPKVPNLHYAYGLYLHLAGHSQEALDAFKQELEISPDS